MVPASRVGGCVWLFLAAGFTVAVGQAELARAQGEGLEGTWRAGATTMNVAVQSWGPDCGPQPKSSKSKGGGTVKISRSGGHLVIQGKNHVVQTDHCWSRNPAMRRLSSAYLDGTWTTQCKTPKSDARAEHGTYTITVVNPTRLQYRDVSKYNWQLKTSRCVATITTVQALDQVSVDGPRPASPTGAPKELPASEPTPAPTCIPGTPKALQLRPRQAELEIGGRLCFRARVVDATGCELPGAAVAFSVSHDSTLTAEIQRNCFHASDSAAEGQGDFRVLARSGSLKAQAQVTVKALDLSGLIAMRLETGGVTGFEGDEQPASVETQLATRVSAGPARPRQTTQEPEGSRFRLLGTLIGSVAVLILLGLWLRVRLRPKKRPPTRASEATPQPHAPSEPPAPDETWICPNCRIGYPAALRTCPKCTEGDVTLIPYAEFNRGAQPGTDRGKRCRSCGKEVLAGANFCTHCGSRDLMGSDED